VVEAGAGDGKLFVVPWFRVERVAEGCLSAFSPKGRDLEVKLGVLWSGLAGEGRGRDKGQ
jgi:hypothetical protein